MTYNQFITLFYDLATAHQYINTFGHGDIELYSKNTTTSKYGQTLWVNVQPKQIEETTQNKTFTFWLMDFVNDDLSNNDDVLSDTERTFDDVVAVLRNPYYNNFFFVESVGKAEPFQADKSTLVSGWTCDITFKEVFDNDSCQAVVDSLPIIPLDPNGDIWNTPFSEVPFRLITGDPYDNTALASALNLKADKATTITINNVTYDLSANRSWTISTGAVSSVFGRTGAVVAQSGDYTTDQVTEGTNLYYTSARFDNAFGLKSTTNLSEGTNLYFTEARVLATLLTGYISGAGIVSATDTILQAIQKLNGNINAITKTKTTDTQTITGTTMTLPNTPSFIYGMYRNGVFLTPTTDYTRVGTAVTFVDTLATDLITTVYEY